MTPNHARLCTGELRPEDIKAMAELVLKAAGFRSSQDEVITVDGAMDPHRASRAAIRAIVSAFQTSYGQLTMEGLVVDGIAGPKTLALLRKLCTSGDTKTF